MTNHEQTIRLEGSATLVAWFDPDAPGRDPALPGGGQFFLRLWSAGRPLTEPLMLDDATMDFLEGPHLDTLPEEEPRSVEVGPLTIRTWDLRFSVEFRGKVAEGKITELRRGIVRTFM